jgi:dolichyl-phosphate beta-glucosyltransferase
MKDFRSPPFLSIIIPAHNEEQRLPLNLTKIDAFLKDQPYGAEVIVVENGSSDSTVEVVQAFAKTHPNIRLLEVESRGKGLAVRAGMLAARGEYRFICDADLSMPIDELVNFLPPYVDGHDVLIASREAEGSRRMNEPPHRRLIGRIANRIINLTALPGFEDTQCGFKMFRREVAEDLFSVQRMNGIGFDIELLFIAQKRGYKIQEVPITWYYDPDSRIRLLQDSLNLVLEIRSVRRNWNRGLYEAASRPAPKAREYKLKAIS